MSKMILHDSNRPRMFNSPTFLNGLHIIPRLQLWPLSDDGTLVEVSLMLPYSDERFVASWKNIRMDVGEVPGLILAYAQDPERVALDLFGVDVMTLKKGPRPEVKELEQERERTTPTPKPRTMQSALELI